MLAPDSPFLRRLLVLSFSASFLIILAQTALGEGPRVQAVSYRDGISAGQGIVERNTTQAAKVPNGFLAGVSAGYFFTEDLSAKPGVVSDNVRLVRETAQLLAVDVLADLNASADRAAALDRYLEQLSIQTDKISRVRAANQDLSGDYRANLRTLNDQLRAARKAYNTAIRSQEPDAAQQAFDLTRRYESEIAGFEESRRAVSRFDASYSQALSTMRKRALFLTANREAILKGVRVVNVSDTQIKLIFSRSEWEKLAR